MDRKFSTTYPSISSLANASVLVSARDIWQLASLDAQASRSYGKWQGDQLLVIVIFEVSA
jgi:hypothetical protein